MLAPPAAPRQLPIHACVLCSRAHTTPQSAPHSKNKTTRGPHEPNHRKGFQPSADLPHSHPAPPDGPHSFPSTPAAPFPAATPFPPHTRTPPVAPGKPLEEPEHLRCRLSKGDAAVVEFEPLWPVLVTPRDVCQVLGSFLLREKNYVVSACCLSAWCVCSRAPPSTTLCSSAHSFAPRKDCTTNAPAPAATLPYGCPVSRLPICSPNWPAQVGFGGVTEILAWACAASPFGSCEGAPAAVGQINATLSNNSAEQNQHLPHQSEPLQQEQQDGVGAAPAN